MTDFEGMELASVVAAQEEAVRTSGEMMRDGAAKFWDTQPWTMTVTDTAGLTLFTLEMQGHPA